MYKTDPCIFGENAVLWIKRNRLPAVDAEIRRKLGVFKAAKSQENMNAFMTAAVSIS